MFFSIKRLCGGGKLSATLLFEPVVELETGDGSGWLGGVKGALLVHGGGQFSEGGDCSSYLLGVAE